MSNTPQELYQERERRIQDAVETKVPDRVPIWFHSMGFFAAKYSGLTFQEVMYDSAKLCSVQKNMYKAKETLGNTMCISCMMPGSLLQTETPDAVKEYAKKLIYVVGKDGSFIMGTRSAMDEMKPELVKVWVDFTKEYGVYG